MQLVEGKIKVLEWGVPERIYLDDYVSLRPPHPAFKETKRDSLAEASKEARRAGIKITFGIPISRYCINDPAPRAEFMDYCREFTKRYDMDGVMFDGPTIHSFSPRTSPNAENTATSAGSVAPASCRMLPYRNSQSSATPAALAATREAATNGSNSSTPKTRYPSASAISTVDGL